MDAIKSLLVLEIFLVHTNLPETRMVGDRLNWIVDVHVHDERHRRPGVAAIPAQVVVGQTDGH